MKANNCTLMWRSRPTGPLLRARGGPKSTWRGWLGLAMLAWFALAGVAAEKENLVANPGFEKPPTYVAKSEGGAAPFVERGWDLGDGDKAVLVPDWVYNIDAPPALVRVIEDETGKAVHSGKRCLYVNGRGSHIYAALPKERINPARPYLVSLYAKGGGVLEVVVYEYNTMEGKQRYIRSTRILKEGVSDQWEKYEGTIQIANPATETFYLAFILQGDVGIDDVSLTEKSD